MEFLLKRFINKIPYIKKYDMYNKIIKYFRINH